MSGDRLALRAAREGLGWTALHAAGNAGDTAGTLLLPAALAATVDAVVAGRPSGDAVTLLAGLLGLLLVAAVATQFGEGFSGTRATAWLRRRLAGQILALGLTGPRRFAAGDLASRAVTGAPPVATAAATIVDGLAGLAISIGGLIALCLIDWRLVVGLAGAVPLGLVLAVAFVRRTARQVDDYQRVQARMAGLLVDALAGVRTIRASGTTDREVDRITAPLPELSAIGQAIWQGYGRIVARAGLLGPVTGLALLAVAGWGVAQGRLTAGEFVAVAGYGPMAMGLLDQAGLLMRVARIRGGATRLAEVLDVATADRHDCPLPAGPGRLQLTDVTLRFGDTVALDRVTLELPVGALVGVVGAAGAGKTALLAVAGGLLDPDEGAVRLDGVRLSDVDRDDLAAAVGYAFERPVLLGTTVRDAIGYGHAPSETAVQLAADRAQATGFIRRLPGGLATPLDAAPLSGGEAQRLGLARALARPARLLILDDATVSLDTLVEARVLAALAGGAPTCLVTARRAAVAARTDVVVWLESGRVVDIAPHATLWRSAAYRAVFDAAVAP